jgi:ribosomal protein L23
MPTKPHLVYFPEMALTLVRRVTSKLPHNHFLFRTEPKWTKLEIKEYLKAVYDVNVARIATSISAGEGAMLPWFKFVPCSLDHTCS